MLILHSPCKRALAVTAFSVERALQPFNEESKKKDLSMFQVWHMVKVECIKIHFLFEHIPLLSSYLKVPTMDSAGINKP